MVDRDKFFNAKAQRCRGAKSEVGGLTSDRWPLTSACHFFILHSSFLKSFPTENCGWARVRVAGRGPLQPCRNGAVARRGRKKRRPARFPSRGDANTAAGFSVGNGFGAGNYFGADARETSGTQAVRDAARKGISAHAPRPRFVPGADAAEAPPIGGGGPQRDGVEDKPCERVGAFLLRELGVRLRGAFYVVRVAWVHT